MTRIDELLARATPDVERRNRLRRVFTEWERVKHGTDEVEHEEPPRTDSRPPSA